MGGGLFLIKREYAKKLEYLLFAGFHARLCFNNLSFAFLIVARMKYGIENPLESIFLSILKPSPSLRWVRKRIL